MKRIIAFLLCAAILSFGLILTGCSCSGCDNGDMGMDDNGISSGAANGAGTTNGEGVLGGTTTTTGSNVISDVGDGVNDLIDGADNAVDDVGDAVEGAVNDMTGSTTTAHER